MTGSLHSHQVLLRQLFLILIDRSGTFHDRKITNFSWPFTLFPKQFKDFFSFPKLKDFSMPALNSSPAQEPWKTYLVQYIAKLCLHCGGDAVTILGETCSLYCCRHNVFHFCTKMSLITSSL